MYKEESSEKGMLAACADQKDGELKTDRIRRHKKGESGRRTPLMISGETDRREIYSRADGLFICLYSFTAINTVTIIQMPPHTSVAGSGTTPLWYRAAKVSASI